MPSLVWLVCFRFTANQSQWRAGLLAESRFERMSEAVPPLRVIWSTLIKGSRLDMLQYCTLLPLVHWCSWKILCKSPALIYFEHILCYLTYIFIGCARASPEPTFVISHIYFFIIIIFAALFLCQYLDYIENVEVKSFVLVPIELLLLLLTFCCTV